MLQLRITGRGTGNPSPLSGRLSQRRGLGAEKTRASEKADALSSSSIVDETPRTTTQPHSPSFFLLPVDGPSLLRLLLPIGKRGALRELGVERARVSRAHGGDEDGSGHLCRGRHRRPQRGGGRVSPRASVPRLRASPSKEGNLEGKAPLEEGASSTTAGR